MVGVYTQLTPEAHGAGAMGEAILSRISSMKMQLTTLFGFFSVAAILTLSPGLGQTGDRRRARQLRAFSRLNLCTIILLLVFAAGPGARAANRSTYIPYDEGDYAIPDYSYIAFDQIHQQIFTAWPALDRIDVLSAADYQLIASISVPSPSSLDISPDGTTLAVGTLSAHILFFDTETFVKTNDVIFPESSLGITAFVYTANGNAFIRAQEGLSTGGGITAYWVQAANAFINQSNSIGSVGPYQTTGPLARSGDYSTILLGDATSTGNVQIINGNTGQVTQQMVLGGDTSSLAANNNASRFAICVQPAGYGGFLLILDSSLNLLYQDGEGCTGMVFSADGSSLYRDVSANGMQTQALNMTTFSATNITTYLTGQAIVPTDWQAADATGMVYGIFGNDPSTAIFIAVDTTQSSTPPIPAVDDPVQIIHVIDNIGSPGGGDLIRILCSGVDTVNASSVSVSIGGQSATNLSIAQTASEFSIGTTLPNLRLVEVKTPSGAPGLANVTLNVNGTTSTAAKAFQYAQSSKIFPFSTSLSYLLYDDFRQKLYASHGNQVEVIDPIAQQVLTPLVPVSGKSASSQFAGLSLSPDGDRLYIADTGTNLIHMLDLSNPGTGVDINPTTALGSATLLSPARVFETASGKLLGSSAGGFTFLMDGLNGGGTLLTSGFAWSSASQGEFVYLSTEGCVAGLSSVYTSSCMGMWNDAASQYVSSTDFAQSIVESAANADGTVIAAGGSTPGIIDGYPEIVDFNMNTVGLIENHFDAPMPEGTPSFFLHPSGALLYKAGQVVVEQGLTTFGGLVEIDDLHQYQPAGTMVLPDTFLTSYSPYTNHYLAADQTGQYFFGVTQQGLSMMVLNTIPLSIGNLQPAFGQPAGGQTVTIRGSGFLSGAIASFGGVQAATSFVDVDTLTATVPELSAGWQDVTVTNTNGMSYTAHGMFQVIAPPPTPAITGFSPGAILSASDIAGMGGANQTVTIQGSGFAAYDTVLINGQIIASAFLDSSDIQATVPGGLTAVTGSVPLSVVSPYTGSSNVLSLPVVNPVPAIEYVLPGLLVTGSSSSGFTVYGTDLTAESVVQWNGLNLTTTVIDCCQFISATVPASLLASSGTANITVFNPSPGGGTSNTVSEIVANSAPDVAYPTSISFGQALLNITATQTIQVTNVGSANYTISSATINSSLFSVQTSNCANLPYVNTCTEQVNFTPTTAGPVSATLMIIDNAPGSPHVISLSGTGTASLAPAVTLTSINSIGQTVTATVNGTATVGGSTVPAMAWIEYGTSQTLATFTQSPTWSFTGNGNLSGSLSGLNPATTYAARLAVQTAGGTGLSSIRLFTTIPAAAAIALALASGASNTDTIDPGQTATYQLMVSDGGNGYTGTATFTCTATPSVPSCTISPSSVSIGVTPTPITVTVTTTGPSNVPPNPFPRGPVWMLGLLLALGALVCRKKRYRLALAFSLMVLAVFAFACGGGGSSSSTLTPAPTTAAGNYYMQISATSGGAQTSYLLTMVVE